MSDGEERLDRFLADRMPEHSRAKIAAWISEGGVRVEGRTEKPSFRLKPGLTVEVDAMPEADPHDLTPADIPISILWEDDDLLVVDKPRGLATHPAPSLKEPSLVNALLGRTGNLSAAAGEYRPGIVHRLDKETTGLLVVAKNDSAHAALSEQFAARSAVRRYVAWIGGNVGRESFRVEAPIGRDPKDRMRMAVVPGGKPAATVARRLRLAGREALVSLKLETGRTHQIRVHLAFAGCPVYGDALYAPKSMRDGPLQLHAAILGVRHPRTGETLIAYTPPPEDFRLASGFDPVGRMIREEDRKAPRTPGVLGWRDIVGDEPVGAG